MAPIQSFIPMAMSPCFLASKKRAIAPTRCTFLKTELTHSRSQTQLAAVLATTSPSWTTETHRLNFTATKATMTSPLGTAFPLPLPAPHRFNFTCNLPVPRSARFPRTFLQPSLQTRRTCSCNTNGKSVQTAASPGRTCPTAQPIQVRKPINSRFFQWQAWKVGSFSWSSARQLAKR